MKKFDFYLQKRRFVVADQHLVPTSHLLDIGCNQGEFFVFLQSKNITGTGVDPEAEISNPNLPEGVSLIKDHFPSEKLNDKRFDFITALAVFEHIPDEGQPAFLESCNRLLSRKGKMIITVPSPLVDNMIYVLRFFGIMNAMSIEEHHGFDTKNVVPLFKKAGFRLVSHKRFEFGLNNVFVFEKDNE